MYSLTDLKNLDLERLDPTRLDLTRFDLRNLPTFDADRLTGMDLPAEASRVAEFVVEAASAGIGAVATTAQKADELRRGLTEQARRIVDAIG